MVLVANAQPAPEQTKRMLKDGYNKAADQYLAFVRKQPEAWKTRLAVLEHLYEYLGVDKDAAGKALTVLDLGCGAGEPSTLALAAHPGIGKIIANDQSSAQLGLLKKSATDAGNVEKLDFIESDMMTLSLPDASLDAVVAYYSIIHLPTQEQIELMSRIRRWLKPGAYFAGCFTAEKSEGHVMKGWLGMDSYWSGLGAEGSEGMLEESGFRVQRKEVVREHVDASFLFVIAETVEEGKGGKGAGVEEGCGYEPGRSAGLLAKGT